MPKTKKKRSQRLIVKDRVQKLANKYARIRDCADEDTQTHAREMEEQFTKFLDGVSDAFFVKYYDSTPCGFRWAVLDFEAHTSDTLSVRFHTYRLFGQDTELHEKLVRCFDERRKNVMLYK